MYRHICSAVCRLENILPTGNTRVTAYSSALHIKHMRHPGCHPAATGRGAHSLASLDGYVIGPMVNTLSAQLHNKRNNKP